MNSSTMETTHINIHYVGVITLQQPVSAAVVTTFRATIVEDHTTLKILLSAT